MFGSEFILYCPVLLFGNDSNNVKINNCNINGFIWGEGTGKKYLRDDGTWNKVLDTECIIVDNNKTLTEDNIKNVILVNGNYTITVPNIKLNAIFYIKNISSSQNVIIHPSEIIIDGTSEDIILRPYEYIQIVQYSNTEYAIITENRTKFYNLMEFNLENNIPTKDNII